MNSFKLLPFVFISCFALLSCSSSAQTEVAGIKRSLTTLLNRQSQESIEERVRTYISYKKSHPDENVEEEMNMYAYRLMWEGSTEDALVFFKLIVDDYSASSNAYDSYAEALMNLGRNEEAILNYEKSLALDPTNFNAEDQLEKLRFPDKKSLSPTEKFYQQHGKEAYLKDLEQLVEEIMEYHPNPTKFTSQSTWKTVLEEKKSLITEETIYGEFIWHCNELVALMNCSHSGMSKFWIENQMLEDHLHFPLKVRWINNRLYVIDPLENDDLIQQKDEILRINGKNVSEIMSSLFKHIVSQGHIETTKWHEFNLFSTAMLAYELGFPKVYEIEVKKTKEKLKLLPVKKNPGLEWDETREDCGGELCMKYLDKGKKIGMMTIQSFNYYERDRYDEFVDFIDFNMKQLKQSKTEHLIIDLRGNGGGSPESSIYLLRHLMNEPFQYFYVDNTKAHEILPEIGMRQSLATNRFVGSLYFLIDGVGNSTTGHFMSLVKKHELGDIIGEELGSNQFCNAGMKRLRLKNSKLDFHVANNTNRSTASEFPDEVGILPDHEVYQSIDDYLEGKDVVKQYAIDLISQELEWQATSGYHTSFFLEANPKWQKELFQFPLSFAPKIEYQGIEDARFLPEWRETKSSQYWSYAFSWNLMKDDLLNTEEIERSLAYYYDGLMRMEQNAKEYEVSMTEVKLNKTQGDSSKYNGVVHTFDNFFEKKPLTLHVTVEQLACKELGRTMLLFRLSKQDFGTAVWDSLNEITWPKDICRE